MTDRESAAAEWQDQDGWDGLVRLLDDLVRDTWGECDPEEGLGRAVDSTSGVYDSSHFVQMIKLTVEEIHRRRSMAGYEPAPSEELAIVATRILDWERLRYFVGEDGRAEVCSWVAQRLDGLLGPGDDIGRVRPDTFGLLLRGRDPAELPAFAERCVEAVESETCGVYSGQVDVRVRSAVVEWEGERAESLVDRAVRETSED